MFTYIYIYIYHKFIPNAKQIFHTWPFPFLGFVIVLLCSASSLCFPIHGSSGYTANNQGHLVAFFGSSSAPGNWRLNSGLKIRSSRHHVTWVRIIRGHSSWIQTLENQLLELNVMEVDGANDIPFHVLVIFEVPCESLGKSLKQCSIIRQIPQNFHTFFKCVSSLIPSKLLS